MDLHTYKHQFAALHQAALSEPSKAQLVAMLLAIIDLIEDGSIIVNQIVPNDLLIQTFDKYSSELWFKDAECEPLETFLALQSTDFSYQYQTGSDATAGACLDQNLYIHLQSATGRKELRANLLGNPEDLSKDFSEWALNLGKSQKTVKNYVGALKGPMSTWNSEAGVTTTRLTEIHDVSEYQKLIEQTKSLPIFQIRDSVGKGMYSAALKLYGEFLSENAGQSLAEDLQEIALHPQLTSTEKTILVNARVGQGQYRQNLINYWKGCAVTGFNSTPLLVASHIKPWRKSNNDERLDPYNGLLLLPNLDKVFDLGYISFRNTGEILVSYRLENYELLGITKDMEIKASHQHHQFLEFHRDMIFQS